MKVLKGGPGNITAVSTVVLLLGAMAIGFFSLPSAAHASSAPVGIVIPLYGTPTGGTWSAVIQAKEAYPNVPFVTIIWPTTSQDSGTLQGVENLQAAGIKVIGYVTTDYGAVSISSAESQVADWKNWYGVNGIMFDQMNNAVADQSYYSTLNSYVHSEIPGSFTVGNPGTQVPDSLIGTFDMLIVFERASYPTMSFITYPGYPPSDFGVIAHGVALETSFLTSISGVVGWVYLTDSAQSYDVLPTYFTTEVATLASMDEGSTTASLSVTSVDLSGQAITGMWTTFSQNGVVLSSGFTPRTFTGTEGDSYVIHVGNYGNTVFCYWQDGNTNDYRTVTLTGGARVLPHVLELTFGVDRNFWAVADLLLGKDGERTLWRLPTYLAPVAVGVFPLIGKEHSEYARRVADDLAAHGVPVQFDDTGTIGKRYARVDEAGTPFCVTIDGGTVGSGPERDTVTLRERDPKTQTRVPVGELAARVAPHLVPPRPGRS